MTARTVESLLDDFRLLGGEQLAIVEAVRAQVRKQLPAVTEEVKYGGILFASDGVVFGGVFAYRAHVSVEFGHGAAIDDPFGHLEGAGKGRRHLKLRRTDDIRATRLAAYLPLALAAAQARF
jgi:hypothetical protein